MMALLFSFKVQFWPFKCFNWIFDSGKNILGWHHSNSKVSHTHMAAVCYCLYLFAEKNIEACWQRNCCCYAVENSAAEIAEDTDTVAENGSANFAEIFGSVSVSADSICWCFAGVDYFAFCVIYCWRGLLMHTENNCLRPRPLDLDGRPLELSNWRSMKE